VAEMRSKIVKSGGATWRLWLGLGLSGLAMLSVVLSTLSGVMLMFAALSVLIALVGLVQLSLWSTLRRSWL
jgi:hypothetical protein